MIESTPTVENNVANAIATQFEGGTDNVSPEFQEQASQFDFDEDFQTKIASCVLKDPAFNHRVDGLIKPEYFESASQAVLVNLSQEYYRKYSRVPDMTVMMSLLKRDIGAKIIRKDLIPDIKKTVVSLMNEDIGDSDYVVDRVAEFARNKAVDNAILKSVDLRDKGDYNAILREIKTAVDVGANEELNSYDYFKSISKRTQKRKDEAAGIGDPRGIPTGIRALDKRLYHKGWGIKELTVLMGAAKAGKSTALANFAKNACMLGKNVLFVTLEVSSDIVSERLDASIAQIAVRELGDKILEAEDKIKKASENAGIFMIEEFETGSLTSTELRRIIQRYKSKGIVFDMIVVDYADIMAPDYRTNDPIENSKSIYIGLRAISQSENVAMLTATQTNREGAKSSVAKMEHVSEDFNKIRIADLVISINKTDEEKRLGQARLYFAASRNQAGDFSIHIKQELEMMIFVSKVLKIE